MFDFAQDDLYDLLTDPENEDPILLVDDDGTPHAFLQVALLSMDEEDEKLYALLSPITEIEHVEEDEVLIFRVLRGVDGAKTKLVIEEDEETAEAVFDAFLALLEEEDT